MHQESVHPDKGGEGESVGSMSKVVMFTLIKYSFKEEVYDTISKVDLIPGFHPPSYKPFH